MKFKIDYVKIFVLYLVLISGGLLNFFGVMTDISSIMAGLIIIAIGLFAFYEYMLIIVKDKEKTYTIKYLIFFVFVLIISWLIEYFGVKSGIVFGEYEYSDTLIPQISKVPIAIGFAWFSTLISSAAIVQQTSVFSSSKVDAIVKSLAIALFMVFFDFMLEPVAVKLDYWQWESGIIPTQNYITWFIVGFLFSLIGYVLEVFTIKIPNIIIHIFVAQIIYFSIVLLS